MTGVDQSVRPDHMVHDNFRAGEAVLGWMQQIAPYGIFTTDADLRIHSWNDWLALHTGRAATDVVGRVLTEVFPEIAARRLHEHFHRALAGEVVMLSTALHKYLLPMRPPADDPEVPHMLQTVRIAPLTSGDGIAGTVTLIEDVTQRETQALQLLRQQERDRLLSAALAVLLRSSDPLRDVAALFPQLTLPLGLEAYFNHLYDAPSDTLQLNSAAGVLPKQREALALLRPGESLCSVCARERKPVHRRGLQDSTEELAQPLRRMGFRMYCCFPLVIEDRLLGTLAFASSTRDALASDEIECLSTVAQYVAIAMDRAQRERALREAQRSLREHAENLETKVVERTARLHETIAQLESFSYTVAHDLRAPIRSLQGYSEILRTDFSLPDEGVAILDRLQRASRRLDALTRDLLRFTRIARQQIELEPVDIDETVKDLMVLNPALQHAHLTVRSPLGRVRAHRTLLQQCLSNLLDNALKFVPPDATPRVAVWTERRVVGTPSPAATPPDPFHPATRPADADAPPSSAETDRPARERVRIWVEDNGIGIAAEAHHKIFGIFERVSGHDHIEGTGIGLAIVARAVEQMEGTCGVESTLGRGSRFWLEFAPAEF